VDNYVDNFPSDILKSLPSKGLRGVGVFKHQCHPSKDILISIPIESQS
jgi:hypothetical protein